MTRSPGWRSGKRESRARLLPSGGGDAGQAPTTEPRGLRTKMGRLQ